VRVAVSASIAELASAFALGLALVLSHAGPASAAANLALGRPYALEPAPDYPLCSDPGDATQLTDGDATRGTFWTAKTTVGWQKESPVTITLDLGRVQPISGASFRTAAGKGGVDWPESIDLLVSDDGSTFHPLGDLVALSAAENGAPPPGYRVHAFASHALRGRGRFVRLIVAPSGPFVFCDEVEVYAGPAEWASEPMAGVGVPDTARYFAEARTRRRMQRALRRDLAVARARVADTAGGDRAAWNAEISRLHAAVDALPVVDLGTFRAVLPMGPVHAAIFALIGRVDAARGASALSAWRANPWAFLAPTDGPPASVRDGPELSLLRGETRPATVDLRNATGEAIVVHVKVSGLGAATVRAAEVAWTETQAGIPVAAALPDAPEEAAGFRISVPAGMTRQVWLWISAGPLSPGRYAGVVSITAPGRPALEVPLAVRVVDAPFPDRTRLHVGGWDYTNTDTAYGLTPANVGPLVAHLRSRGVDSPWATSAALPFGGFDAGGRLAEPPDPSNLDAWISRWPDARRYLVFIDAKDRIGTIPTGAPAFEPAVAAWLRFWVARLATRGVRPDQLHLLLVDEPHDAAALERLLPWARAVRRAGTGVRVFEDATFQPPPALPPALAGLLDVFCVHRTLGLLHGSSYWSAVTALRSPTRRLEIYQARGPTRTMSPYSYYRLQAWQAFAVGAEGSSFWAFADGGGLGSWNELAVTRAAYTPLFLAPDSVTAGKHMEAIVESEHDFEVLSLLRDAVQAAEADAPRRPLVEEARRLLRDEPARVLGKPTLDGLAWTRDEDPTRADTVRAEAADLLVRLRAVGSP
jgi:F5/8 type C domain